MTKITIPDARTLLGQTREENQRLREELARLRLEVDAIRAALCAPDDWPTVAAAKAADRAVKHLEAELATLREENQRLREELAKVREVNEPQAEQIRKAQEKLRTCRVDTLEEAARCADAYAEAAAEGWSHNVSYHVEDVAENIRSLKEQPK